MYNKRVYQPGEGESVLAVPFAASWISNVGSTWLVALPFFSRLHAACALALTCAYIHACLRTCATHTYVTQSHGKVST